MVVVGSFLTGIDVKVIEDAHVRAAATLLMAGCSTRREAKLTAAMMDMWEPEFTNAVQRRIDKIADVMDRVVDGRWQVHMNAIQRAHREA